MTPPRKADVARHEAEAVFHTSAFFLRRLSEDQILMTAGALCYATALAVVPALAVIFGAMSMFPASAQLRDQAEAALLSNLAADTGLKIQQQFEGFLQAADKLTEFGVVGLLLTAIMLFLTIEGAFNRIFRVTHPRPLLFRLIVLWAVVTIGPFLIAVGAALVGIVAASPVARDTLIGFVLSDVVPLLLTWAALAFLYVVIPNRPVRWSDAAIGAAVATLALVALRQGFAFYIRVMTSYDAIYGTLSAVPVVLLWIYLIWVIVLAGAVVVVALPEWRMARKGSIQGPALELAIGLEVLVHLADGHRSGTAMSWEHLAAAIGVPDAALLPVLEDLRRGGYVAATDDDQWILARDLAQIPLVQLVHFFGFGIGPATEELRNTTVGERVCRHLDAAVKSEQHLLDVSLAEVIRGAEPETVHV